MYMYHYKVVIKSKNMTVVSGQETEVPNAASAIFILMYFYKEEGSFRHDWNKHVINDLITNIIRGVRPYSMVKPRSIWV